MNPRDELGQLTLRFNRLLERLQEAFRQQRRFMADASHELRTPLSAALTATQVMLRDEYRSAEEYREALQIVGEQLLRLRRIVEDIFLLARADTALLEIQHEEFYLDELVVESCRAMRLLAERNGVKLQFQKPLPEVRIWGDTGPGIPEFVRPHLFERFYRVDAARSRLQGRASRVSSGAGLGLAIAQWIAEQHGSRVFLESSYASGSVFAFQLTPGSPGPKQNRFTR